MPVKSVLCDGIKSEQLDGYSSHQDERELPSLGPPGCMQYNQQSLCQVKKKNNVYLFLRKRQNVSGRGAEREGDTESELLSCQHRARCKARTYEP